MGNYFKYTWQSISYVPKNPYLFLLKFDIVSLFAGMKRKKKPAGTTAKRTNKKNAMPLPRLTGSFC